MITDKQAHDELRTKFEQWVESDGPLPCGGIKKQRTSGGGYSLQAYNYAWEAWKASAAETLNVPPVAWTDAEELRDLEKDGCGAMFSIGNCKGADPRRQILLFTRPAPLRDTERQELKQRIAALDDAVTSLFFRNYPRRSRAVEAIFFLLFVMVMLPLWPLAAVCLLDRLSGKNY
ncbi:TPA: DUF4014 family protein [Salmonella enterica subsp. enterica serovar Enteritidis]